MFYSITHSPTPNYGFLSGRGLVAIVVTISITYLAFLQGWWLPVVPVAIAIILVAIAIAVVTRRQLVTMQLKETVRQLMLISQSQLTVRKIAFELLKQGESQKNRAAVAKIASR